MYVVEPSLPETSCFEVKVGTGKLKIHKLPGVD